MGREADIAWAAGFFDGEGCIGFYRDKKTRSGRLRVSVTQAGKQGRSTMLHFASVVGSRYYLERRTHLDDVRRPCWKMAWSDSRAIEVLQVLRPYLIQKGPEADIAIRIDSLRLPRGQRYANHPGLLEEIHALGEQLKRKKRQ